MRGPAAIPFADVPADLPAGLTADAPVAAFADVAPVTTVDVCAGPAV
ncbi:hypothetical protein [Streptomyces smyrnaeus]